MKPLIALAALTAVIAWLQPAAAETSTPSAPSMSDQATAGRHTTGGERVQSPADNSAEQLNQQELDRITQGAPLSGSTTRPETTTPEGKMAPRRGGDTTEDPSGK